MRYIKIISLLSIISLIAISSVLAQETIPPPPPPPPGAEFPSDQGLAKNSKAPAFNCRSLENKEINLNSYLGKYVILDFWGTWCVPCRNETPFLKKAYEKYGNKIQFIGVAVDYEKEKVINYLEDNNIAWPQVFVPFDSSSSVEIINNYNIHVYPSIFLINPEGIILYGAKTDAELEEMRGENLIKTLDNLFE